MNRRRLLGPLAVLCLLTLPPAFGQKRDELRDRYGRLIGTIVHQRNGVREARTHQGKLLGNYNPKTNETRDRLGRLLTKGDSLAALLMSVGGGRAER